MKNWGNPKMVEEAAKPSPKPDERTVGLPRTIVGEHPDPKLENGIGSRE
jgi:hypothetical protein